MSNGAIYLEHAGMLISIYNGLVLIAISRMRENPRGEGKIERCRKTVRCTLPIAKSLDEKFPSIIYRLTKSADT